MILHVMILDKFLAPFIDFVDEHFGRGEHKYVFITSEKYEYGLTPQHNVEFLHTDDDIFITLHSYMKQARKIILHGLWRDKVNTLLYFNQELLKKCYWVMWGGDYYFPEKHSLIKKNIIENIGFMINSICEDVKMVRCLYGAKGFHINSFFYVSNLYKKLEAKQKKTKTINIQLGNSATETNNHFTVLDQLAKYKDKDIKIFAPLSYGDKEYAKQVSDRGKEIFDNKFIALKKFMPFDKYQEFLSEIDIAIFAHNRIQAIGNIINLLGMGKKIYLNNKVVTYQAMSRLGVKVYDINKLNIDKLSNNEKINNINIIEKHYSKSNLIKQLSYIFSFDNYS